MFYKPKLSRLKSYIILQKIKKKNPSKLLTPQEQKKNKKETFPSRLIGDTVNTIHEINHFDHHSGQYCQKIHNDYMLSPKDLQIKEWRNFCNYILGRSEDIFFFVQDLGFYN